jgi:uncharacterized protein
LCRFKSCLRHYWGKSNPLAVPELILEMRRCGHAEDVIGKIVYDNPLSFFRQCTRWQEPAMPAETSGAAVKDRAAVKV